jgi:hypothetical protein
LRLIGSILAAFFSILWLGRFYGCWVVLANIQLRFNERCFYSAVSLAGSID